MEFKKVINQEQRYYLNNKEYFLFDQEFVRKELADIPFPIIIMDTEFFNKSHDLNKVEPQLYDKQSPDLIYTLSFSVAKSYQDLLKRDNEKSITKYSIRRRYKDHNFDFKKQLDKLMTKFFDKAFKEKVQALVFAGKANDEAILNRWLNQNKSIVTNKVTKLIEKKESKLKVKAIDIYPILENGVSLYIDPNSEKKPNFKNGKIGENTFQIPSLKSFYEFINLFPNIDKLTEETDIYHLCVEVLKLFSLTSLKLSEYKKYQQKLREAIQHCHNDVYKLIYLIYFLYVFSQTDQTKNPFLKELNNDERN